MGKHRESVLPHEIGSGLGGRSYILDEPSIGLHQRDNDKLLKTLCHLRDLGNTLIVVEHDEDTCVRQTVSWISDRELGNTVDNW